MRYTGPRNKVARREGVDLDLKTSGSKAQASLLRRLSVTPGQHGARRRRKQSERGKQLRQKQTLRYMFGVSEHKLKSYFKKAVSKTGNTATHMGRILELRIDNVVFRAGFTPTRASARQLVNHAHVTVNGKKMSIPSHQVQVGDVIAFADEKSLKIPYVETELASTSRVAPEWLERKGNSIKILAEPTSEDIERQVDMRSVIEYYSR